MTCFWTGLVTALNRVLRPEDQIRDLPTFIRSLQSQNLAVTSVVWNGEVISDQFNRENQKAIGALNSTQIQNGYDCSSCDPVLLLVAQLYDVDVEHLYGIGRNGSPGIRSIYRHPIPEEIRSRSEFREKPILRFASDQGHFWAV